MNTSEEQQQLINVEVAHGTPEKQLIVPLKVPQGTTAYEAIQLSNIVDEFPNINPDKDSIGIFSKPLDGNSRSTAQEYVLQEKDRVEIYRPLIIDPKEARAERAQKKQKAAKDKTKKATTKKATAKKAVAKKKTSKKAAKKAK